MTVPETVQDFETPVDQPAMPLAQHRPALVERRPRRIYICHPFAGAPAANQERIRGICRQLAHDGAVPVAPQLYLPQFLDEDTERGLALTLCLDLIEVCDEVRVYDRDITAGMRIEIARAEARAIPVHYVFMEAHR